MKVLLSWLREFAPFEGDAVALGEQMSDLGMAVESITTLGQGLDGIVVAKVLGLRVHPDADKIQLVDVDAGDGETQQICCGAFNMAVGDLVPLATIGTLMPSGMKIERRKLRGQWSNGMLCSLAEMGLGDDQEGIAIVSTNEVLGTPIADALGIHTDVLYDLEINPNRPDAGSVAGVARDLAARLKVPFAQLTPVVSESAQLASQLASVEIVDADLCGRFLVRVLHDVRVATSPQWIANRLTHLGMRPINNVVDISNYVMLELGQPNHTYDLDKVPDGALRVRWARDGETIRTLDDVERTLDRRDGVIADRADRAIGIAGVMGGASTEISSSTTAALLEMAWWDPMTIAKSSKRLGLRSEASMRFERGADPEIVELAALRFAQLLSESGATLAADIVDARGRLPDRSVVQVRTERVNDYLGIKLTGSEIRDLLRPIGFEFISDADNIDATQGVVVPTFRLDTTNEPDIIEEIARHYGYGRIPRRAPRAVQIGGLTTSQAERRLVRQTMVGLGLSEAMPLPFLAPEDLKRAGLDEAFIAISNPLASEESVLRVSLRPGLLRTVAYNASHRNEGVQLFEIGKVFRVPPPGGLLPDESEALGVVLAGEDAIGAAEIWHVLAETLAISDVGLEQVPVNGLHPTRSAEIRVNGSVIGVVGEIAPDVLESFAISERVGFIEVDLAHLLALPHGERRYRPISRFPSSDIDLAFAVAETTPAGAVERVIADVGGPLLVKHELFDVYRGPGLPDGWRSLAFRIRLQATDRTLTEGDIAAVRNEIIAKVTSELSAKLRT